MLIFCIIICTYADAPRIAIDPSQSPYMVTVGERLLLYCIAEGFPIPTIRWYENNTLVPQQSSPFHLASTNAPGTTLYTCEGKNSAGNMINIARENIRVVVKCMLYSYIYIIYVSS